MSWILVAQIMLLMVVAYVLICTGITHYFKAKRGQV